MGSLKFTFEAGALLRGPAVKGIKNIAFMQNLSLKIDEDKGILDSNYRVKLEGPDEKILSAKDDVRELFSKLGAQANI